MPCLLGGTDPTGKVITLSAGNSHGNATCSEILASIVGNFSKYAKFGNLGHLLPQKQSQAGDSMKSIVSTALELNKVNLNYSRVHNCAVQE
jgi:hypothetical protein